jgi:hypothetical protein
MFELDTLVKIGGNKTDALYKVIFGFFGVWFVVLMTWIIFAAYHY